MICLSLLLLTGCKKNNDGPEIDAPQVGFSIYATETFTYIQKPDGTLWARGGFFNSLPETTPSGYYFLAEDVAGVSMDEYRIERKIYFLKKDATLWLYEMALSIDEKIVLETKPAIRFTDNVQSVMTGNRFVVILKKDGTVWASGGNTLGQMAMETPTQIHTFTQIAQQVEELSSSGRHLLIYQNGQWLATGDNQEKQLSPSEEKKFTTFTAFDLP